MNEIVYHIIGILFRLRWIAIASLSLSLMASLFIAVSMPKIYQSETLILVQPQKVPTNYVQSLVSVDIETRLNTISQQILSRTNLEKIIGEFNLYSDSTFKDTYLEDKIADMRRRITVKVANGRRSRGDTFSVAFEGPDPGKVMTVANALASYVIDENLKVREDHAIGTSQFIDNEREVMQKRLEDVEEKLKTYRERYMGELPEQLDANLRILDRLQEQLTDRLQHVQTAGEQLIAMEARVGRGGAGAPGPLAVSSSTAGDDAADDLPDANDQIRAQLDELKGRYTDRHPDVIRLKRTLEDVAEKSGDRPRRAARSRQDREGAEAFAQAQTEQAAGRVQEQRRHIASVKKEIDDLQKLIIAYRQRVEATPKREQELMSLKRDYQNIQGIYSSLLNRKLEAEIAVNMEKKQKGEQFRIIDFAKTPQKPISPDVKMILLAALTAGLGTGAGLIYLVEYLDSSFRSAGDLEKSLDLKVLAVLPEIVTRKAVVVRWINIFSSAVMVLFCMGLLGILSLMAVKGVDQTMAIGHRLL